MALSGRECYTLLMDSRQGKLLVAIIDQFIETALPVGSKRLLEAGEFCCSSATLRSEMSRLTDEGFLEQPHVSAGRVPTAKGYRMYVRDYLEPTKNELVVRKRFATLKEHYFKRKDQERAYEAVGLLARMIPHVAFATVPHKPQVYYMGLSNIVRQPEFQANPGLMGSVAEVLEDHLTALLKRITVDTTVRYYIGEDHLLPQIQSCSLMVRAYSLRGEEGTIGILGPLRMDYSYNTVALELAADLLHSH